MNEQPQWKLRVCEERKKSEIYREDIFRIGKMMSNAVI